MSINSRSPQGDHSTNSEGREDSSTNSETLILPLLVSVNPIWPKKKKKKKRPAKHFFRKVSLLVNALKIFSITTLPSCSGNIVGMMERMKVEHEHVEFQLQKVQCRAVIRKTDKAMQIVKPRDSQKRFSDSQKRRRKLKKLRTKGQGGSLQKVEGGKQERMSVKVDYSNNESSQTRSARSPARQSKRPEPSSGCCLPAISPPENGNRKTKSDVNVVGDFCLKLPSINAGFSEGPCSSALASETTKKLSNEPTGPIHENRSVEDKRFQKLMSYLTPSGYQCTSIDN